MKEQRIKKTLEVLEGLPHRGHATLEAKAVLHKLRTHAESKGWRCEMQAFHAPKTYLTPLAWMLSMLALGLVLVPYQAWAILLVLFATSQALWFFDWRAPLITKLPRQHTGYNLQIRPVATQTPPQVIFAAHYDTAPLSLFYHPGLIGSFRQSLLTTLAVMVGSCGVAACWVLGWQPPALHFMLIGLAGYFGLQLILSACFYVLYGYSPGGNDNGSGLAAAFAAAEEFARQKPEAPWELVLFGAEETGMLGARAYLRAWPHSQSAAPVLINFDSVGRGLPKIITESGSLTTTVYDNVLVDAAKDIIDADSTFNQIKTGSWRTGDFDSLWFQRAGWPCLTLSAQDERMRIPDLHTQDDTLAAVNPKSCALVAEFAAKLAAEWTSKQQSAHQS